MIQLSGEEERDATRYTFGGGWSRVSVGFDSVRSAEVGTALGSDRIRLLIRRMRATQRNGGESIRQKISSRRRGEVVPRE
jgi:cyclopropane fatty-acyl-phospholipid synthase-like methyltransferase